MHLDSRLKILGMTEGVHSLNASITPCLSPLNASIRGPQYLKTFGFPIKDFGNDEGGGCLAKFQA